MPCPLCGGEVDSLIPTICNDCYLDFNDEKEAGTLPQSIVNGNDLRDHGFQAWRLGKLKQKAALNEGKSVKKAEAIGLATMEEEAKKERAVIARQQALRAQKEADEARLFPHRRKRR